MYLKFSSIFFAQLLFASIYGLPQLRILGGDDAPPASAPYQVIISYMDNFYCSGVIIHQHAILTAAQCFIGESPAWFKIIAGTNQLHEGGTKYPLHYYVIHPQYSKIDMKNDVAVGIIKETIQLGPAVSPIALGSFVIEGGTPVNTSGWGMTSYSRTFSENMKRAQMKTVDNVECGKVLEETSVNVANTEICTVTNVGEGMCYGDGGNPLVYNNILVGIGSWGVPCGKGYPDVYQRISSYLKWVYQTLEDSPFTQN